MSGADERLDAIRRAAIDLAQTPGPIMVPQQIAIDVGWLLTLAEHADALAEWIVNRGFQWSVCRACETRWASGRPEYHGRDCPVAAYRAVRGAP